MRVKKTRMDKRDVYRYPVNTEDGTGGYRRTYVTIVPDGDGVTEVMIRELHRMDDNEVTNNVKNGHPKLTDVQKAEKKEWEEGHPGEKYTMHWNVSLDHITGGLNDPDPVCGRVPDCACYDPIEELYVSDEVLKLREIAAEKMTARQRQAYELIGLMGYSRTEAAGIMGVSTKVAKIHYDKAIECIRKNFK